MKVELKFIDSLKKVFTDEELCYGNYSQANALKGEVFSLQVAFKTDQRIDNLEVEINSELRDFTEIRRVGLVPLEFIDNSFDDNVLRNTPGMYPDLLTSLDNFRPAPNQWHTLWFTIRIPKDITAKPYPFGVKLKASVTDNICFGEPIEFTSSEFILDILNAQIEKSPLIRTEWLHSDCIYTLHKVEVMSDEFWEIMENYFKNMVEHGISMVYTPLFTPPLDTRINGERPTMQLVQVFYESGKYSFDFSYLQKWINLANKSGIDFFEFSHLFTQWGALKTPKIIINVDGEDKKVFGWHIESNSNEYKDFLNAFLPELQNFISNNNLKERSYFHISDEPTVAYLERYREVSSIVKSHLKGYKFIDALSEVDFFQKGLVEIPIPCNDHIEPFMQEDIKERWVYYCTAQNKKVSNQFIHYPSSRNRIMGMLMYYYGIKGFLQWGYNFWYAQFSKYAIDPYRTLDAGGGFQPGDSFKVYPGEKGPLDSIRHEVFFEAVQDYTALYQLEKNSSREEVLAWLEKISPCVPISMKQYPTSAEWILEFRTTLNRKLVEKM